METSSRRRPILRDLLDAEVELCRWATRAQSHPAGNGFFRAVSRLGDGWLWFALALALPLVGGGAVLPTVGRMAAAGVLSTLVAAAVKRWTGRARPYRAHAGIRAALAPLDRWSFPSGHTLHAVAFTAVLGADLPALALLLVPFTLAVAASRVALGLHYPSDVLAGAGVGGVLAALVLLL